MRKQIYLIIVIILAFASEFFAQALFHLPIFVFVPITLYLMIISQNLPRDLMLISIPILFYDFMNGFVFGNITLSFLILSFLIFTFKKYLRIDGSTILLAISTLTIASLIFSSLFFFQINLALIIRQYPTIIAETILAGAICASIINYYVLG